MPKTLHAFFASHGFRKPYDTLQKVVSAVAMQEPIAFIVGDAMVVYEYRRTEKLEIAGTNHNLKFFDEFVPEEES